MARIWPLTLRNIAGHPPVDSRIEGGMIDRDAPLEFHFDGELLTGFAGDTLASALRAHGRLMLGRSAKFRRPRGIGATVLIERNGHVSEVKADEQELYDGLVARRVNRWLFLCPWVKTSPPTQAEIEHVHDHADVLIVGGGPEGLRRAVLAAESGADIILVERDFELGGRLLHETGSYSDISARDWRAQIIAHLRAQPNVRLYPRTTAIAREGKTKLLCEERVQDHLPVPDTLLPARRLHHITAGTVEMATGAEITGFVFQNNDLPGILDLKSALALVHRYGVRPGAKIVLYGNHDEAYSLVSSFLTAGVRIAAIIDTRNSVPAPCHQLARRHGIPLYPGHCVVAARGHRRLRRLILRKAGDDPLQRDIHLDCDSLIQSAAIAGKQPPTPPKGQAKCFVDPEKEILWSPDSPAYSLLGVPHPLDVEVIVSAERLARTRTSPLQSALERADAAFFSHANWHLAEAYPATGETVIEARDREVLAVRNHAGLSDISSLGRIDIQGADAAAFIARIFGGSWAALPAGHLRHDMLCRDNGGVLAGVIGWRLAAHHYLLTTATTTHAAAYTQLTRMIAAGEKLTLTDITDEWGAVALEGPASAAILAGCFPALAKAPSLPPMGFVEFEQDELPLRLARVALSGGAGYEIQTRSGYADILWNLLREKGKSHGLAFVGLAAREILRIEAGRIGLAEINGGTTADALGFTPADARPDRKDNRQLVGLKPVTVTEDAKTAPSLIAGMTLYEGDGTLPRGSGIGQVTSACYSPTLGHDIALALLAEGWARMGTLIRAVGQDGKTVIDVKVCAPRHLSLEKEQRDA